MMLTHVTIVVKDQNKALEFYTQKIGFEKKADYQNPGQASFVGSAWSLWGDRGRVGKK